MSDLKISSVKKTVKSEAVKKADNKKKTITVPVGQGNGTKVETKLIVPTFSKSIESNVIDIAETLGLKPYNLTLNKDSISMLRKSQTNLIDLIKYYDGDPDYYYEGYTAVYNDTFGKKTTGFGHYYPPKTIKTQEEAYKTLAQDLKEANKILRNKIGAKHYDSLPLSIREALIDLAFNKGPDKLDKKPELMKAIKNNDYSKIVANLYYLTSGSKNADNNRQEAGLYRRSLSRAILAARDLTGKELEEAKKEIDTFYNKAKNFYVSNNKSNSIPDLESVYQAYKKESISVPARYADNFKIKVTKGSTVYSVANEAYNALNDTSVSMMDYRNAFYKLNKIDPNNPHGIKAEEELLAPSVKNVKYILGQSVQQIENKEETDTSTTAVAEENTDSTTVMPQENTETVKPALKTWWKTALSGAIGAGFGMLAGKFIKTKNVSIGTFGLIGFGLGIGISKLIKYFKNKNKDDFNPNDPNTTQFQRFIHEDDVKFNEINRHKVQLENGKECEIAIQIAEKQYTVKPYSSDNHETVWSIANKYGMSRKELGEYNDLELCVKDSIEDYHNIKAGQVLTIKRAGYKVEKGDSLESIAEKFGITKEMLVETNNIYEDDYKLKKGTILELPAIVHKIKKGDTLYSIAQKCGTTVDNIKMVNNLSSDNIPIGTEIVVICTKDPDQKISSKKTTDGSKEKKVRVYSPDLKNRPELQEKTIVDGKVVATRNTFEPTAKGPLSGKTIVLNAGHGYRRVGGTDSGAVSDDIEPEWLLNYDNVMRLKNELIAKGAKVIYLQGHKPLVQEAMLKDENKCDLFISIHANATGAKIPPKDRTQIYYAERNVSGEAKNNSIKFSKIMAKRFNAKYKNNEYTKNGKKTYAESLIGANNENRMGLLRHVTGKVKIPSVIWEVGYMDSPTGKKRLKDSDLMKEYADVACQSVLDYFKALEIEAKKKEAEEKKKKA